MRFPSFVVLTAVFAACGTDASPDAAGCPDLLSADAWVDGEPLRLVELWRAGGTNEGEELALPIGVAVAPDGRVAIPDWQLGLAGVEADGSWIADLAPRGEGPGEVALPVATAWTAEGHLGVFDFDRARAVFLDRGSELVREDALDPLPIGAVMQRGELSAVRLESDGDGYVQVNLPAGDRPDVTQLLFRLPYGGAPAETLAVVRPPALAGLGPSSSVVAPGFARLVFDVDPHGRIALGSASQDYEIRLIDPDGSTTRICRNETGHALRPDETGQEIGGADPSHPLVEPLRTAPRPERPTPIGRLFFGRDGRLWVERDRREPLDGLGSLRGRAGSRYDVFDAQGAYLGPIQAPPGAYLMAASTDRVWAFETGSFGETWVVAYGIES
ncbi:MAG: hypothetical protein MJB57_11785 [Gemmatimonadetes bacterium]|nr:hypothetical protein [Gemmatimonadota bacterium]